jgi:NADH dehydrogenase [ubiquinone] 1 alpha subcomplex assembly factor 7
VACGEIRNASFGGGVRAIEVTPLHREIAELIAQEGPISVERYMGLALSHPRYGYYRTRDPFGAAGDFVTAPEISQIFGELIGLWAADRWDLMGRPAQLRLVELGPGRGTLMADALRATRIVPQFRAALDLHLVETSETLRQRQEQALAAQASASWHRRFEDIPAGPMILIANEFFDALPIRQYVRAGTGWHERLVGLAEEGALAFGLAVQPEPTLGAAAPIGAVLEVSPQGLALARAIAERLVAQGGVALIIDYGHVRQGFGDSFQAVRRHGFADPLAAPGENDLTAHVDFAALGEAARKGGAAVYGPVTQGDFLRALGIEARAARLKAKATPSQAAAIDAALARLAGVGEGQMGALFKTTAIADPKLGGIAEFDALAGSV